jgi:hypothetical protein
MSQAGSAKRRALLLRFEMPNGDIVAIWMGFGDFPAPVNSLDADGQTYVGLGSIVALPELEIPLNGTATRAVFGVSGVSAAIAALADLEAEDIHGARVNVGVCKLDEDWQVDGDVYWSWDGVADKLSLALEAITDGGQAWKLALSCGTVNIGRRRAPYANWTDAQHQKAHPGDLFLNQVPVGEKTERWPGG